MTEKTRIRQIREGRGLSLRKVAEATGIPLASLQRIEVGNRHGNIVDYARRLAEFYDYEVDLADIHDPLFDREVAEVR